MHAFEFAEVRGVTRDSSLGRETSSPHDREQLEILDCTLTQTAP